RPAPQRAVRDADADLRLLPQTGERGAERSGGDIETVHGRRRGGRREGRRRQEHGGEAGCGHDRLAVNTHVWPWRLTPTSRSEATDRSVPSLSFRATVITPRTGRAATSGAARRSRPRL